MPKKAEKYTTMDYLIEIRFWTSVNRDETKEIFKRNKQLEGQVYIRENKELGITTFQQAFGPRRSIDLMRAIIMGQDHIRRCVEDN